MEASLKFPISFLKIYSSTRRKSAPGLQNRMVYQNNQFPHAKLAWQLAVRSTGAQH